MNRDKGTRRVVNRVGAAEIRLIAPRHAEVANERQLLCNWRSLGRMVGGKQVLAQPTDSPPHPPSVHQHQTTQPCGKEGGERWQASGDQRGRRKEEAAAAPSSSHTVMAARFHPAERDLAAAMTPTTTPLPSPYYGEASRKTRDLAQEALPKKDVATADHERTKGGGGEEKPDEKRKKEIDKKNKKQTTRQRFLRHLLGKNANRDILFSNAAV
ncbi:hypothetical protein MRX96_021621 [Rhipicephalus microplus]